MNFTSMLGGRFGGRKMFYRSRAYRIALAASLIVVQLGCARAIRTDARQVAEFGSKTSAQISALYEAAQRDATDTYELDQFYSVYANPAASVTLTELDKVEDSLVHETNRVLASRVRLARAMKDVYGSYSRMADYDNAAEMNKSVGALAGAAAAAASLALAPVAAGAAATGIVTNLLKAIASELGVARQNRSLVTDGRRLIPILEKLRGVIDAERKLISYEGAFPAFDATTGRSRQNPDGTSMIVRVPGIAGRRVIAYKRLYQELVSKDVVISTPLLNRFLAGAGLVWPDTPKPFTTRGLKAGVNRLIEIDAHRRGKAADVAGEELVKSIDMLIALHRALESKQSLSLQEALEQSALTQFWIDVLKERDVPTDEIVQLLAKKGQQGGGDK